MIPEKWIETINNIKDKFEVIDSGKSFIDEEGGIEIEHIEFAGPMGRMRLEYVSKPIILDKKTSYSKRIGSETQIEYVYSDEEKSHKLAVYKWDENESDWNEIEAGMFDK